MNEIEKKLFKKLCSFLTVNSEDLEKYISHATPNVLGMLFFNRMSAIAYYSLKKNSLLEKVNREFRTSLRSAYEANIKKNIRFINSISYISDLLKGKEGTYAMLKGAVLCEKYPEGCRSSNDIDLLVYPDKVTEIGEEANKCQSDFFFSIHSNATGTSNRTNQPLMLYRGYTDDPVFPEAKEMSGILNKWLLENEIASWSSKNPWLAGDWTFYDWGTSGLGVLRKLTIPGMLSEGSYHDYIPETYRLMSNDYCWLEAYHFVQAIMEYFGASEKFTTGVIGGSLMDSRLIRTDPVYGTTFFEHDQALPIMNATVSLVNDKGETVETYTTQDLPNGVYMFKSVAPGNYKVKFTHPEYRDKEIDVVVEANKVTYENVYLDRVRNTPPEVVEYSPVWNEGASFGDLRFR